MKVVADIALYSGGTHEVDPLHETKRFLDDQEMIYNCHALGVEVESTVEQLMVILEKLHEHLHSKSPRLTSAVKILYQADGEASIKN
ncbi:hypothetical protein MP228_013171 [Amoeboaphelidium protococcarum]|nr:hypothetical protein MP228_013171 [Amoeboaphelidium protococcarum]